VTTGQRIPSAMYDTMVRLELGQLLQILEASFVSDARPNAA